MDIAFFETAIGTERLRRYQEELGSPYILNGVGAKGPTFLMRGDEPVAVWTDQKTRGYKQLAIVDKLVFGGGNWQSVAEKTPLDTYMRERREEIKIRGRVINKKVFPFARYFTALPKEAVGNEALSYPYCDLTSIFVAEVPLDALYEELQMVHDRRNLEELAKELGFRATESKQMVTPVRALVDGTHTQFGWGDDHKTGDIMLGRYGIRTNLNMVPGVESIRLDDMANEAYEASRELLLRFFRPDNNPFVRGQVEPGKVFKKRE